MIHRCYRTVTGEMYPVTKLRTLKSIRRAIGKAITDPNMTETEQDHLLNLFNGISRLIPEVER